MKKPFDNDKSFYLHTKQYWSNQDTAVPAFMGVATYGDGGVLEASYRHSEEVRNFKRLTSPNSETSLLELGSGNGRWVEALAPLVRRYEAVDFSPQMIAFAKRKVEAAGIDNVIFVESSVVEYKSSDIFEIIYLSGVSMYLVDEDLVSLIANIRQNLAPGARLIERATFHKREEERVDDRSGDGYAAIYRTPFRIRHLFEKAGFIEARSIESYDYFHYSPFILRLFKRKSVVATMQRFSFFTYPILRFTSRFANRVFGPFGEMEAYTHRFLVFADSSQKGASIER